MPLLSTLLSSIFNSDEAKLNAEVELEARKRQYLAIKSKVDSFVLNYKNDFLIKSKEALNGIFNPILKKFIEFSKQFEDNKDKLLENKRKLQSILNELEN